MKLCPKYRTEFFCIMPRGHLTKDVIKCEILKLKVNLDKEWMNNYGVDPKWLAHQYLNKLLEKVEEYRS